MKAAIYYSNSDIRIEEFPKPQIQDKEVLIKVRASGICGTDVMEWYRKQKAPRVLGHEVTGDIVEVGRGVEKYNVGDKVFVSHHVPCNNCKYCSDDNHTACETLHTGNYEPGGFSEFIRIPEINVKNGIYLLKNLSYEEGTMIEPLACVVRGQRIINVKKNHTVLILGSGISGLMNIQIAKLKGARVVATDINEYRLGKAKEFGADEVINGKEKLDLKADKIIICTGVMPAVTQAFECIDRKGTILFFAIPNQNVPIPIVDFWRNELTVTSSYGAAPVDLEESLKLIKEGRIDVKSMITHTMPLEDIQKGFKVVQETTDSLKVVLI